MMFIMFAIKYIKEKRYKEFLAFVPEGKETDPMTSDYQIRWRSAMRSYGKNRDDFDEW